MLIASDKSVTELVGRYIKEIEKLKSKLIESDQMYQQLRKASSATQRKNLITFADSGGLYCKLISIHCESYTIEMLYLIETHSI